MTGRSRTSTTKERRLRRSTGRKRQNTRTDSSQAHRTLQLPPRRALIGGALVAMAAMGVFVAHRNASSPPETRYLVAAREVAAGTTLTADDLGSVALDLPGDMDVIPADRAGDLIGRVTATSLSRLELVASKDVHAKGRFANADTVEVAFDLPAARALAGVAEAGSVVDVLSTDTNQGGTQILAEGIRVTSVDESHSAAIGSSGAVRVVLSIDGTEAARTLVDASLRGELTLVLPRPTSKGER